MVIRLPLRQRLQACIDFLTAPLRGHAPGAADAMAASDQAASQAPGQDWQFSETVLMRKSALSSSALIWTAVGITIAGTTWAVLAPLDETIAVPGKLQPSRSVLRVDAPEPGKVEALLVREGQHVRLGQPLLRFDLREPRSTLLAAQSVRDQLRNEIQIMRAALGEIDARGLSANQQLQLISQQQDLAGRLEAAREDLRKSQERLRGINTSLATAENVAGRYKELQNTGAVSAVQVLESLNRVQDLQAQRSVEQREIARLEAVLRTTGATQGLELRKRIEANLSRIAELDRDISQARQRIQYGVLTAPANGQVFDIAVSAGSVVQQLQSDASQPVLRLVPDDALQAKVFLPNRAIGFVRVGQRADLSLDTFPASDYGRIPAVVASVGSDALTPNELNEALGSTVQGLYFPAVLRLKAQSLKLPHKQIPLQAGMSLTADIQLRQRRFISILSGFFQDQRRSLERLR